MRDANGVPEDMITKLLDEHRTLESMVAALAILPEGVFVVHSALQVEYLKPASPGVLTATARVLEQTDRDVQTESELRDADCVVVARGKATLRVLARRD